MSRPEPPRRSTRPTLFGAARGSAPDAPLRMLSPPDAGRWFAVRARRRPIATAAALLLAAAVGAVTIHAPTRAPPARPARPAEAAPAPVVEKPPFAVPAAAAVIESIEPPAPPAESVALPAASFPPTAAHTSAPRSEAAPKPRRHVLPAREPAPADPDVDLLAAMVTRLRAADAAPAHEPAAVPRVPAR